MRSFFLYLFFISSSLTQTLQAQDQSLRAYMDSKQFYAPGIGNYLELYFQFVGHSVKYKGIDNGLKGELAVILEIFDENNKSVNQDAYRLETPFMKDSIVEDFYDLKRFALNPGKYTLNIEIQDLNSNKQAIKASQGFEIEELSDGISISDLEVIEYALKGNENSIFHKSGYVMIPRISTFYPTELSSLPVYVEIYNTNQLEDSVFAVKQCILNADKGNELEEFTSFTRHKTEAVTPILRNIDITNLPTGRYILNYTLLSRSMKELAVQSYVFERSNDKEIAFDPSKMMLDPSFQASITNDSVTFFLESLIPISKAAEAKNLIAVLKTNDKDKQRKHIQAYWMATAPNNTYEAWIKYKQQVQLVQRLYSNNFQAGYETDRGRVYLQYGSPTTIVTKETSPTEYPYEIWQYNKIGIFSNKRFIFYNPDLVNNTYRLLHSDMVGELKNPAWPQILSKRNTHNGTVDNPNQYMQQNYGSNSNDLFRQY